MRFIVGGSVSIDHVVYNVGGIAVINDFRRVNIGGFEEDVALSVIEHVFRGEGWEYSPEIGRAVLDSVGDPYIPYFIMILLSGLKEEVDISGGVPSPALVERVYTRRILGSEGRHYFEHYSRRLRILYTEQEAKAARAILGKVSVAESLPMSIAYDIFRHNYGSGMKCVSRTAGTVESRFLCHLGDSGELKFYSKMLRTGGGYIMPASSSVTLYRYSPATLTRNAQYLLVGRQKPQKACLKRSIRRPGANSALSSLSDPVASENPT